jgi:hypothetical protein
MLGLLIENKLLTNMDSLVGNKYAVVYVNYIAVNMDSNKGEVHSLVS